MEYKYKAIGWIRDRKGKIIRYNIKDVVTRGLSPCVHIAGKISSSQDGVVVYTDGCVPCHTAGHGNCPKVLLTYGQPIKF